MNYNTTANATRHHGEQDRQKEKHAWCVAPHVLEDDTVSENLTNETHLSKAVMARLIDLGLDHLEPAPGVPAASWCAWLDNLPDPPRPESARAGDLVRCPACGEFLTRRNGRFGAFLGCTAYPECRYTARCE